MSKLLNIDSIFQLEPTIEAQHHIWGLCASINRCRTLLTDLTLPFQVRDSPTPRPRKRELLNPET